MAFPLRTRKDKAQHRPATDKRQDDDVREAVRQHLDRVEVGSPLLYPF